MKKVFLILLFSSLVFTCSQNDSNSDDVNEQISTIEIGKGNLYGNGDVGTNQQNLVITNESSWTQLMNQMNSNGNNVTEDFLETDIDFSAFTVIAVLDEIKPNGGHILDIEVTKNSNSIIVEVTDLVPNGDSTLALTQPFYIAKIPNQRLPIIFE